MNWIEENVRDEKLLGLLSLELLDHDIVAHGDELAALVGEHNSRLVASSERFARLAADRKRLVDFKVWAGGALDAVLAERVRLMREVWDWLQALRAELAQRKAILAKAETVLKAMLTDLAAQREQTVARLSKSIAKVHKEHILANPYSGEAHFAELIDNDDAVVPIDRERARLQMHLEWATDHRRRADADQFTVLVRQEETFENLLK